jgi:erythromycin esterase-like protein/predicted phosphoribosyltransferase
MRFRDRRDAGQHLAERLTAYAGRHDVIVLGLPRGGVPVAFEVAQELDAPLDVFLVRKLGVPAHPELAMGAIAAGGVRVLSEDLISELGIPRALVEQVAVRERLELERRDRMYRGTRPFPTLRDRIVIVIDDGLATGSTMEAAVAALRAHHPARIVVAAPVAASETCARLRPLADEVVCAQTPEPFNAVGLWYERFDQTSDEEVIDLLKRATSGQAGPNGRATQPAISRPDPSGSATRGNSAGAPRDDAARVVGDRARVLTGESSDYDALIDAIGDARLVLIGEASHGTHEFYQERAYITERLIVQKGFNAVAIEADWPDAYRVNRYVRGDSTDNDSAEALAGLERFPTWMWRNTAVVEFVAWLRAHNDTQPAESRVGFYGLDLYSLRASMDAVLKYLAKVDPEAARRARDRYACFDQFGAEPQSYGYATEFGLTPDCEREAVNQLVELQRRRAELAARDGRVARDEFFYAEQNARLVRDAEQYYRTMFREAHESWNLRDRHMVDTLVEIMQFLDKSSSGSRVVVWAHNSHLGDARATEMSQRGELNVGQLVRERFGMNAVLIGQTTHTGTVTAASDWGDPAERKIVRPSLAGSYERLFHDTGVPRFLLSLRDDLEIAGALAAPRLERAIGVIYRPRTERMSHYFRARLPEQFDFVLHLDETRALEPLERTAGWEAGEVAETFPSGL